MASTNDLYELMGYDPVSQAGLFQPRAYQVQTTPTPQLLVPNNATRIYLHIFMPEQIIAGTPFIGWGSGGDTSLFMQLPTIDGVKFKYGDMGGLVGYDWYVYSTLGPVVVTAWEVAYRVPQKPDQNNVNRPKQRRSATGTEGGPNPSLPPNKHQWSDSLINNDGGKCQWARFLAQYSRHQPG